MKVTLMLADAAHSVEGKLYILGGGWTVMGPPTPFALVGIVEIPHGDPSGPFDMEFRLLDGAGGPPALQQAPDVASEPGEIVAGARIEDIPRGSEAGPDDPLTASFAIPFPPLPLAPGRQYRWHFSINGQPRDDWTLFFRTRTW